MDGIPGRQPLGRPRERLAVPCAGMVAELVVVVVAVVFTMGVDDEAAVVCGALRFLEDSDAEVGTGCSL